MKPKILLVSCSSRSEGRLSPETGANTDIGLYHAMMGVQEYTYQVEHIRLSDWFNEYNEEKYSLGYLMTKFKEADGIIFGMPVYYGYFPSLLQALYAEFEERNISLFPKVVGFICSGSKRGGGQTNAIVFAAWEAMKYGAAVVNEGAPLGQFGGNIVAGDKDTAPDDSEGMGSSLLLGRRLGEITTILLAGNTKEQVEIQEWDTDKLVKENRIQRCIACDECPKIEVKEETGDYGCVVRDGLEALHPKLVQAEGIVLKGINKIWMERMRYMRRDNYRFAHAFFEVTMIEQVSVSVKYTAILCREKIREYTALYKSGQREIPQKEQIYIPVGYKLEGKLRSFSG